MSSEMELRQACRARLEMLEAWLRRLVDERIRDVYGECISRARRGNGDFVTAKDVRKAITRRIETEPARYKRDVDALLLDDLIEIICHPQNYPDCFRDALATAYPQGASEARTFLTRLVEPRNRLSHDNPISVRQAEQVVCYTGDVIASLQCYYGRMGVASEYNAPRILRFWDSLGNVQHADLANPLVTSMQIPRLPQNQLRPGNLLAVEIEVGPSFSSEGFEVYWSISGPAPFISGEMLTRIEMPITSRHVSERMTLGIQIRSHKEWHRLGLYDDYWEVAYRVLPPV